MCKVMQLRSGNMLGGSGQVSLSPPLTSSWQSASVAPHHPSTFCTTQRLQHCAATCFGMKHLTHNVLTYSLHNLNWVQAAGGTRHKYNRCHRLGRGRWGHASGVNHMQGQGGSRRCMRW